MNKIDAVISQYERELSLYRRAEIEKKQVGWLKKVKRFFHKESKVCTIYHRMISIFDRLETIPVRLDGRAQFNYQRLIKRAQSLQKLTEDCPRIKKLQKELSYRLISMQYRVQHKEIAEVSETLASKMTACADKWKRSDWRLNSGLTNREIKRFQEASKYPDFCTVLLDYDKLRIKFFKWVIKYKNNPEPFIEYPCLVQWVWNDYLASRIGFYGGEALQIEKKNSKKLTLLFEGKPISILNKNRVVHFKGGVVLSIGNIFQSFRNKEFSVGDFEFFENGICSWNVKKMGYFNVYKNRYECVDVNKEKWWESLPTGRGMPIKKAIKKYQKPLDGKNWIVKLNVSRHTPDLPVFGTHAYLEAAFPKNDGTYHVLYFGKYSVDDQFNLLDFAKLAARFVPGTLIFPDENIFYNHRQHKGLAFMVAPEKGMNLMKSIKKDLINASCDNFPFQLFADNCLIWARKKLAHHLGSDQVPEDLFAMDVKDLRPQGFLGKLFAVLRKCAAWIRSAIFTAFFFLFGSWRGRHVVKKNGERRWVSLYRDSPWKKGKKMHHPAKLFFENGQLIQ